MNIDIVNAIVNKQRMVITYNSVARLVEPHAYGLDKNGVGKLRVFQVAEEGEHTGWRLFNEDAMSDIIVVSDDTFKSPAYGYRSDDQHLLTIYAQL